MLVKAEEKYREKLSKFRGVPHESAQGELSYSDLKVWEDHVQTIKEEIEALKKSQKGTLIRARSLPGLNTSFAMRRQRVRFPPGPLDVRRKVTNSA